MLWWPRGQRGQLVGPWMSGGIITLPKVQKAHASSHLNLKFMSWGPLAVEVDAFQYLYYTRKYRWPLLEAQTCHCPGC